MLFHRFKRGWRMWPISSSSQFGRWALLWDPFITRLCSVFLPIPRVILILHHWSCTTTQNVVNPLGRGPRRIDVLYFTTWRRIPFSIMSLMTFSTSWVKTYSRSPCVRPFQDSNSYWEWRNMTRTCLSIFLGCYHPNLSYIFSLSCVLARTHNQVRYHWRAYF